MDGTHAFGCTLMGLALTALLVRLFWMKSPPFNAMSAERLSASKNSLVALTLILTVGGAFLLSRPVDPETAQRIQEESYRFDH